MTESTFDVLSRMLRDTEAEAERAKRLASESEYALGVRDSLDAQTARIKAAMAGTRIAAAAVELEARDNPEGLPEGRGGASANLPTQPVDLTNLWLQGKQDG